MPMLEDKDKDVRVTAADKKRIEAFVQREVMLGLYLANDPTLIELATDSDDNLFESVLDNCYHVWHVLTTEATAP